MKEKEQFIEVKEFAEPTGGIKYRLVMKPVFNFSSVEMECVCSTEQLPDALRDFGYVYNEMKDICIEDLQSKKPYEPKKPAPKKKAEDLATERQREIMDTYGIEYDDDITKEEAQKLIKDSYKKVKDED